MKLLTLVVVLVAALVAPAGAQAPANRGGGSGGPGGVKTNFTPGDPNGDGIVDEADIAVWAENYAAVGEFPSLDMNGDQVIDAADYTGIRDEFTANFGAPTRGVPEPSTLALLLLGVAGLRRRARHAGRRPAACRRRR